MIIRKNKSELQAINAPILTLEQTSNGPVLKSKGFHFPFAVLEQPVAA